eukprot:CAMPEP_0117692918 /NCGR_PEP_ID=MMETSP0804-20121206/26583_1 /TAXON_ID=1074897 /ORGANISM="Tetraselmis astigmatica, Strain CCMP880" /LENGTH=35 /DNA_ID= /DNA_START= /DNA_END= /DNA_ORIENTATION=
MMIDMGASGRGAHAPGSREVRAAPPPGPVILLAEA